MRKKSTERSVCWDHYVSYYEMSEDFEPLEFFQDLENKGFELSSIMIDEEHDVGMGYYDGMRLTIEELREIYNELKECDEYITYSVRTVINNAKIKISCFNILNVIRLEEPEGFDFTEFYEE